MKHFFTFIAIVIFSQITFAQSTKTLPHYSHIFSADSLAGFDEEAAKRSAFSDGFLGDEFKVKMFQLKRIYINSKYNLKLFQPAYLATEYNRSNAITPACTNDDFESSASGTITTSNQINGWTITEGTNSFPSTSCNLSGCCPGAPAEAQLISAPASGYIDPVIGSAYPIFSVFGTTPNTGLGVNPALQNMSGNNFIKINSNYGNYSIEKISKTFVVTPANALFQVAYITVFFNAPHACCDAAAFQVKLTNVTTNSPLSCPGFSTAGLSSACSSTSVVDFLETGTLNPANSTTSPVIFNKWRITSLDLSGYIGQTITVDITANDCTGGSHYAYAYVDTQCSSMSISSNNNPIAANTTSVILPTCGYTSVSIVAPQGLGPYMWSGPAVSNPYNTFLMSNQVFTTNVSGNYTLTMNPDGACFPITKVLTVSLTPAPSPLSIAGNTSVCINAASSLTVIGASTYTWSTGLISNVLSFAASTNTVYTVTGTDLNNCISSTSVNINLITSSLSLSGTNTVCIGSSTTYTAIGAVSYSLNGTPTASVINILPVASSNYSISGIDTYSCISTQTISVVVNTTCANVWPGDANSDGVADNLDILELGLQFTQTGPVRTPTSNLWQSYFANNWVGLISNGDNLNHADCNGDGAIDQNDTLAIFSNYNFTHAFKNNSNTVTNPQLIIMADQNFVPSGYWGTASIYLGDISNPVNNINGTAFTLNFDKTHLQFDSVYIEYPVSFLNIVNHNLNFRKKQFNNGVLYAATTHTNNINASGNGKIAVFHFKVNPAFTSDTVFTVGLTNANQSNSNGATAALTTGSNATLQIGYTLGIKDNSIDNTISVFPNPTNGAVIIKSTKGLQKIEMLNATGQIVLTETAKGNSHQLNLEAFAEGIYFAKIYNTDNSIYIKKIVLKN